jgi:hypothetical protein
MTVKKLFTLDAGELDVSMEQLVEVLAQLLAERADPHHATPIDDLHLLHDRAIHVIDSETEK